MEQSGWTYVTADFDLMYDENLTPVEKLTIIALSMFSDKSKKKPVHPSQTKIAGIVGVSIPTLSAALKSLESKGYIRMSGRMKDDGSKNTNLYTLIKHAGTSPPPQDSLVPLPKDLCNPPQDSLYKQEQDNKSNDNKSKSIDMRQGANGQNSLFAMPTKPLDLKNMSQAEQAVAKVKEARAGKIKFSTLTNRDFTLYFIHKHNQVMAAPLTFDQYTSVTIFRDNVINDFKLTKETTCAFIDELVRLYAIDPERHEYLSFGMLQKNYGVRQIMGIAARKVLPVAKEQKKMTEVEAATLAALEEKYKDITVW